MFVKGIHGKMSSYAEWFPLTMALGDVVDQFHDEDGLPNTSTSEEANLSTLLIGSEKVDNLWGEAG